MQILSGSGEVLRIGFRIGVLIVVVIMLYIVVKMALPLIQ